MTDLELNYYYGLPTCPKLLAKSNPAGWRLPRARIDSGYPAEKDIYSVDPDHPICGIWDQPLGEALLDVIDRHAPRATSVDVCRICYEWEVEAAPPILWIGVELETLSRYSAQQLISECLSVLSRYDIDNVEVEIKESATTLLSGPRLYNPNDIDRIDGVTSQLTSKLSAAIGLAISIPSKPDTMGTGSFFLRDGHHPADTLLLTAGHVVGGGPAVTATNLPASHPRNRTASRLAKTVCLSGPYLDALQRERTEAIREERDDVLCWYRSLHCSATEHQGGRARAQVELGQMVVDLMEDLQPVLTEQWCGRGDVKLGEVFCYAPTPAAVKHPRGWIGDWALVRIDPERLPGGIVNYLDLSPPHRSMARNRHSEPLLARFGFDILRLQGIVTQGEIHRDPLTVFMRGAKNRSRIGLSLTVDSMIRTPSRTDTSSGEGNGSRVEGSQKPWYRAWSVTSVPDRGSRIFFEPGDSGAGVVTRDGRVVGIVTCGSRADTDRRCELLDVAYVTPMHSIIEGMKECGISDPQLL